MHRLASVVRIVLLASFLASTGIAWAKSQIGGHTMGFGTGPAVVDPVRNRLYINGGENTPGLKIVDGDNNVSDLPFTGEPLAFEPLNDKLILKGPGATQIRIIHAESLVATGVNVGQGPHEVAVNGGTGHIYVANRGSGTVTIVDGATFATTTVAVGTEPQGIGVNEATNKIYVATASNGVVVIDGATQATTALGGPPEARTLAINVATNKIYTNNLGGGIIEIDGATNAKTPIPFFTSAYNIAVNPLTNKVYVGAQTGEGLVVVDGATRAVLATVPMQGGMGRLAVNASTNEIYAVTFDPDGKFIVIDGVTNAATALGSGGSITLNPITNRIYKWSSGFVSFTRFGGMSIWDGSPSTPQLVPPTTTIQSLPGDTTANRTPHFTFATSAGLAGLPVRAVYYQVDSTTGRWLRAGGSGPHTARLAQLAPGSHTLYAFGADAGIAIPTVGGTMRVGTITSYTFTVTSECVSASCADLSVTHTSDPGTGSTNKDAVYKLTASNGGSAAATDVILTYALPASAQFVWASAGCAPSGSTVACGLGTMASGATRQVTIVMRPTVAGPAQTTASIDATELDPQLDDNASVATILVSANPVANVVNRYRLYSPGTLEHLFTTDLNEYTVLGNSGAWQQEGTVGKVLDNPGSFNGVAAVPYYRLYGTNTAWHHWTTDANEYYTLIQLPWWNGEGVDGYILPVNTAGATELYRLNYPYRAGLHHWTVDPVEYNALITSFGWVGEPGAGFVIQ